jgi:choline monooxygenase
MPPLIDADISRASTLPSTFYRDPAAYARSRDRVFARSWQLVADADRVRMPGQVWPFTLLDGCLDEPLVLTRDRDGELRCLSNVCTHRGMLVCEAPRIVQGLRCRYHGRRFGLDGRFRSMPAFDGVQGFPADTDHLVQLPLATWGPLVFVSLAPETPFADVMAEVRRRVAAFPVDAMAIDPQRSRDYLVRAHWTLYCDNYLEGLHIPHVHPTLAGALDLTHYRTELFPYGSVQIGTAGRDEDAIDLPRSSPDYGQRIAGYYFWLFPNLMLNVYPWGISVNIVTPLGLAETRVSFLTYVWDAGRLDRGAGAALDRVEREDEVVVEAVQRGMASRLYSRGRYSVSHEGGVHQFHRLLTARLA